MVIEQPVRLGGVMRCCLGTLSDLQEAQRSLQGQAEVPAEGTMVPCRWCRSGLVFRNGAWEWGQEMDHEPEG